MFQAGAISTLQIIMKIENQSAMRANPVPCDVDANETSILSDSEFDARGATADDNSAAASGTEHWNCSLRPDTLPNFNSP